MTFAVNILLTIVWAGLLGSFDLPTLLSGFVLSYGILYLIDRGTTDSHRYFTKPRLIVSFLLFYIWEIIQSNITLAIDILTPRHRMKPAILAIPLEAKTDFEITLLANLITMTPGTLSLDVSEDRRTLFVHAMYCTDVETLRSDIKNNFERRVLEVFR